MDVRLAQKSTPCTGGDDSAERRMEELRKWRSSGPFDKHLADKTTLADCDISSNSFDHTNLIASLARDSIRRGNRNDDAADKQAASQRKFKRKRYADSGIFHFKS